MPYVEQAVMPEVPFNEHSLNSQFGEKHNEAMLNFVLEAGALLSALEILHPKISITVAKSCWWSIFADCLNWIMGFFIKNRAT